MLVVDKLCSYEAHDCLPQEVLVLLFLQEFMKLFML